MSSSLHHHLRREDGVAMIVALMVSFVVLMLSTIVVAQSIHSLDSSGYDRQRLLSVNAAEAGTNKWYQHLQTTPIVSLAADCTIPPKDIDTGPSVATYNATATFYADDGATVMDCSTFSDTTYPSYALISSIGTVADQTPRTIETLMRLTPNYGGFGAAILANGPTSFSNNFDVYGSSGNDGDVYVLNGDLTISSGIPSIQGNIYVPYGSAQLDTNLTIGGNLWARDDVTIENPSVVKGSVLSELGGINGSPGGLIEGAAAALGDIDQSGGLTINGTVSAFTEVPVTPTQDFPEVGYVPANWTGAGYTIIDNTFYDPEPGADDCAEAYSWITTEWAASGFTNVAVRIAPASPCPFTPPNNATISVTGNLAVISDWGFSFAQRSNWNGSAGTTKLLHFISTWQDPATCTASDNISVGNNANFNSQTNVFFYTPCTATMANSNSFAGQVMATNVSIQNNFEMTYKPVLVPGITGITGFKQDIAYIHEA